MPANAFAALHDDCTCIKQLCWALARIQRHPEQTKMSLLRCIKAIQRRRGAACLVVCVSSAGQLLSH